MRVIVVSLTSNLPLTFTGRCPAQPARWWDGWSPYLATFQDSPTVGQGIYEPQAAAAFF